MAFCVTRILELQDRTEGIKDTDWIPDFRTDASRITGIIIAETSALCITPVIKLNYASIRCRYTDRLIDIRTEDRAGALGTTREIIEVSMTLRFTGIPKLKCITGI
jgi:hypothetical protein